MARATYTPNALLLLTNIQYNLTNIRSTVNSGHTGTRTLAISWSRKYFLFPPRISLRNSKEQLRNVGRNIWPTCVSDVNPYLIQLAGSATPLCCLCDASGSRSRPISSSATLSALFPLESAAAVWMDYVALRRKVFDLDPWLPPSQHSSVATLQHALRGLCFSREQICS